MKVKTESIVEVPQPNYFNFLAKITKNLTDTLTKIDQLFQGVIFGIG